MFPAPEQIKLYAVRRAAAANAEEKYGIQIPEQQLFVERTQPVNEVIPDGKYQYCCPATDGS